jgi:hypothetical protein
MFSQALRKHIETSHGQDPETIAKVSDETLEMWHFMDHDRLNHNWVAGAKKKHSINDLGEILILPTD